MSDYLEKLIGKAKHGEFWDDLPGQRFEPPKPTEKNAVRRDSFDIAAWDQTLDQVHVLREQVEEMAEEHPTSREAHEDLFNLLNQGDPRFTELEAMLTDHVPQHLMMQMMFRADDFQWVRNETKYDEYNTALAMITMRDRMKDAMEKIQDAVDQLQAAEETLQAAIAAAEEAQAGGDGEAQQEAVEALKAAMAAKGEAQDSADEAGAEAGSALAEGAEEAKQKIEAEQAQAHAFGIGPGQLQRMSYAERRALADRLNKNRMAKLAKLVGAFRMFGDAERRRKVQHAPAVIYDVEMGDDLHKLVSSEMNNLAMPELEDLFWLRWAQGGLLQWRTRGPERAGKGPIIVVCDESYSMNDKLDNEGNSREAWSKAVALSLCDQAKRAKRDFIYIGFASAGEMWESHFPAGEQPVERVIEFTEHFFAGGTHYERPLTRAMQIIHEYQGRGKAAPDVVFITDADCSVQPAFVQAWTESKEAADVRCFGIQIGGSGYYNDMAKLVDRCIQIDQLNATPEGVQDLFRTL